MAIKKLASPMATSEEVNTKLADCKRLTLIDLSHCYESIKVHPEFQKFQNFMVGNRVFRFKNLLQGLSISGFAATSVISKILKGIEENLVKAIR